MNNYFGVDFWEVNYYGAEYWGSDDAGGDDLLAGAGNSGSFIDYKREEEDIITVIFAFLSIRR